MQLHSAMEMKMENPRGKPTYHIGKKILRWQLPLTFTFCVNNVNHLECDLSVLPVDSSNGFLNVFAKYVAKILNSKAKNLPMQQKTQCMDMSFY